MNKLMQHLGEDDLRRVLSEVYKQGIICYGT